MDRVIASGSVSVGSADAAPASGTPGYFTNGDPGTATPATVLPGYWLNGLQEEIMAVLAAASISPSKSNNAQLLAAIQALTSMSALGFTSGSGWFKLPTSLGGKVVQWGTAGFGSSTGQSVTFPRSFPTACESFVGIADNTNSGGGDIVEYVGNPTTTTQAVQLVNATTSGFVAGYMRFIAIGN